MRGEEHSGLLLCGCQDVKNFPSSHGIQRRGGLVADLTAPTDIELVHPEETRLLLAQFPALKPAEASALKYENQVCIEFFFHKRIHAVHAIPP